MPHNKGNRTENLQNKSSRSEPSITTENSKTAKRPASLNGIEKQQH
ncbi:hypothetical protein [Paenibacillus beijingensis]|nr:hypothetical protein [Paenibacillus beijingensis]